MVELKSPAEIDAMREAGRVVALALVLLAVSSSGV